jgi:hypothetical protein
MSTFFNFKSTELRVPGLWIQPKLSKISNNFYSAVDGKSKENVKLADQKDFFGIMCISE